MHDVQLLTSCEVQDGATGSPEGPIDPSVLEGHLHIKTCIDCRLCITLFLGPWVFLGGKYEWLMKYRLYGGLIFCCLLKKGHGGNKY